VRFVVTRNPGQAEASRGLINIRISVADRNVIDRAAKLAGKSRSEFMLEASRRAAQETLLDTTLFTVDGLTFKRFKAMLDAPPKPNKRLQALMRRQAPWDHDTR
jgi:uncharacterized protein (DUF1778 family)